MAKVSQIRQGEHQESDPAFNAIVEALKRALETLPETQRAAALGKLSENLKPKTPVRGGDVLNNVVLAFRKKRELSAEEAYAEVAANLGPATERKQVYNALTYLRSRRIIQKKGYGLYVLEDGSVIEGLP